MYRLTFCLLILLLTGCKNPNKQIPVTFTKEVEHINPTTDQQERRRRSEAYCFLHKIPVYTNPNALFSEVEEKVTLRTKDEVVDRAIALCYLELKSENADKQMLAEFDKKYNVMEKLSPVEKQFALDDHPAEQAMIDANWRAESFHVLLWALGFIDSLSYPNKVCVVAKDVPLLFSKTEEQFRNKAILRSKKEILDQADLALRLHWATVNETTQTSARPSREVFTDLDKSVVYERHYVLNWLIRYMSQDWDDVSTDT